MLRFRARRCGDCDGAVVDGDCLDCDNAVLVEGDDTQHVDASSDDLGKLKVWEGLQARALYRHHENLAEVRDKIAMLSVDRGDYSEAVPRLKLGVEYASARYGETSIELGHELLKLSDVLVASLQAGQGNRADQGTLLGVLRQADNIFRTQHGQNSRNCREIQQKLSFFEAG